MRENVKEVCATCKNAVHAEEFGLDMFFCDQLLGSLCEHADSAAPARVLVTGTEIGCLDYYEKDPDAFDSAWGDDEEEEDTEFPVLVFWGHDTAARARHS